MLIGRDVPFGSSKGAVLGLQHELGQRVYPLVNKQFAIENGPFIVDLPIDSMVIFPSFFVCVPEGRWVQFRCVQELCDGSCGPQTCHLLARMHACGWPATEARAIKQP